MKLSDLSKVGELKSSRDYIESLRNATAPIYRPKVSIDNNRTKLDLRPEIVEKLMPALGDILVAEVNRINEELEALGVVVEQ